MEDNLRNSEALNTSVLPTLSRARTSVTPALILLVVVASLGGFLFGYDTGVVSGALIEMKVAGSGIKAGGLTSQEQEVVVSSTVAAAAVGAGISGWLQRYPAFGRKTVIQLGTALFIVGAIIMALAFNLWSLVIGRIVVGVAVGIASQAVPVYVAEVSPAALRGTVGVVNSAMIVFGQVIASAVCCGYAHLDLSQDVVSSWRWMLGWGALPASLMLLGLFLLPESPRWLMQVRNDEAAARKAILWIRPISHDAEGELHEIIEGMEQERAAQRTLGGTSLWQRLCSRGVSRALRLGCMLMLLQQFMGINTIMYYSASILQMASGKGKSCDHGGNDALPTALSSGDVNNICWTVPIASSQLAGNFIGLALADRIGRKPLTLSSLVLAVGFLIALGFSFFPENDIGWLALLGMCAYLLSFGAGMSVMPWVVNAEIYPLDVRSTANSIATAVNWVSNYIVSATFLDLAEALSTDPACRQGHPDGAFWLYALIALGGFLYLLRVMPETRGKTLEEIDNLFSS
mmetsp:Transcript_1798/g.4979  ORF Transcript_1798/g.4979 Transcript_1798/m.4979 type:complete len:517 (-) Transcript_1798:371-1921(-)